MGQKNVDVKILNAAAGSGYTNRKRADILVERGEAIWELDPASGRKIGIRSIETALAAGIKNSAARSMGDIGYDGAPGSASRDNLQSVYREQMANQPYTLKRVGTDGELVRWMKKDRFARGRWNPDHIPTPLIPFDEQRVA